jgi:hypothetical protein
LNVGALGFSGVEANPEGPIQQNSYSARAGVKGGAVAFTGAAGVSLNRVGVYGQVEDSPPVPTGLQISHRTGLEADRFNPGETSFAHGPELGRLSSCSVRICGSSGE